MRKIIHGLLLGSALLAVLSLAQPLAASTAVAEDAAAISDFAAADEPPSFDAPELAVDALRTALATDDFDGLAKLLGLDAAKVKAREGTLDTFARMRADAAVQIVVHDLDGNKVVELGRELWPLPFPLAKGQDGKWAFDTFAGLEEIVNRRVGENELEAIATARAYVDAQRDYAAEDHDDDGVLEFAQKLISSEGLTDGLYWPTDQGDGDSPAGDLAKDAAFDKAKAGEGYYGYRFRILTGQGDSIAGGKYDYVINGNMIAGFALLAWPVKYAETGVHTFAVNQQGTVYETDLGVDTEAAAAKIERFDPDQSWSLVSD